MNEGAPATDLKKIADEMGQHVYANINTINRWKDALDALAAQSQDRLEYLLNLCRARHGVMSNAQIIAETECVFAAPQPAAPQPAVPIEKALNDVAQKAMDYARNTDFGGEDGERLAALRESKDHAARLYALASAAPQRITVSREALRDALHEYSCSVGGMYAENDLARALGIEVKE